jgi:hypothetical protein
MGGVAASGAGGDAAAATGETGAHHGMTTTARSENSNLRIDTHLQRRQCHPAAPMTAPNRFSVNMSISVKRFVQSAGTHD